MTNIERGRRSVGIDIMRQIIVTGLGMSMGEFYGQADLIYQRIVDSFTECGTVDLY